MVGDLVDDVLTEVSGSRGRAVMMVVGIALSTGALVASLAISVTAGEQIASDMAASTLDVVTVQVASESTEEEGTVFPPDVEQRALSVDLVDQAGMMLDLKEAGGGSVSRWEVESTVEVRAVAASAGYVAAAGARAPGYPVGLLDSELPVALLGAAAAEALDVPVVIDPTGYRVLIDGAEYAVVGFLSGAQELESTVVIPYARGVEKAGTDRDSTLLVRTAVGGGPPVVDIIRAVVRPDRPSVLSTSPVVSFASLRVGVSAQIARLVTWIGGMLIVLSTLLISNAMVGSVVSRTSEIGLRRALGASRRSITGLFVVEGALAGLLGGWQAAHSL